ncbi:hypothetical protein TeGR_g7709 [Tetraparma gracilis]|uniref:TMhelix containing protein n=1 Tax=Tetraparma gracilis TaxID=2962635 RepID=A0ABQ6MTL9_9STRA|nr:hypothetical protein TeGR_g7709 [Tetraparma gracilis]
MNSPVFLAFLTLMSLVSMSEALFKKKKEAPPEYSYTLETVCGGWFVACALLTVMLAVKPAPKEVKAAE